MIKRSRERMQSEISFNNQMFSKENKKVIDRNNDS